MADTEPTAAGTLRDFTRSTDQGHVIGGAADAPLVLLNAEADTQALSALGLARLELLEQWLRLLSTSNQHCTYQPDEIAAMLLPMAEDARRIAEALNDQLVAQDRARQACSAAQH